MRAETTGPQWGNAYGYDGFGNLISSTVTKGTAPYFSLTADPATNRLSGRSYDGNGNVLGDPNWNFVAAYDVENRLVQTSQGVAGSTYYGYDPQNHRVWVRTPNGEEDIHLYGLNGRLLVKLNTHYEYVYLGSKLVYKKIPSGLGTMGMNVGEDRVGSIGSYLPYGAERTATANNDVKFATYHRDSTGLDYANQRYYDARVGRFLTADPYVASGGPADPGSWNRYAYTRGDPVNRYDPQGLYDYIAPAQPPPESPGPQPDPGADYCSLFPNYAGCQAPAASTPAAPWSTRPDNEKLQDTAKLLSRSVTGFSADCMDMLTALTSSSLGSARGVDGREVPPLTAGSLKAAFDAMRFQEFGNVKKADLYSRTDPDYYAAAKAQFGGLTLKDDLRSGMAAEFYGNMVYYGNISTMNATTMGSFLVFESLHLLGFGDERIEKKGITPESISEKCIRPLKWE